MIFALVANAGIGVAKFVAHVFTGSGSMLAESIHSFADSGNQGLLLLGGSRAKKEPDERHPLGYGREAYFWALLVAVLLFTMGGGFSLYEGIHKLMDPHPIESPGWAVGVLTFGLLLEGGSLWAAWKEAVKERAGQPLMEWSRETGNVDLLVVLYEDFAAQAGLMLALLAVGLTVVTDDPLWDALGSCTIGVLLILVAVFVGLQVKRLIVGFRADKQTRDAIRTVWADHDFEVLRLIAVWSGPSRVMVALKVRDRASDSTGTDLVRRMNAAERAVRAAHPHIGFQFVEPDTTA